MIGFSIQGPIDHCRDQMQIIVNSRLASPCYIFGSFLSFALRLQLGMLIPLKHRKIGKLLSVINTTGAVRGCGIMHALSDNTLTYRVTEEPSEGYQTAESKSPMCQRGQQPEQ